MSRLHEIQERIGGVRSTKKITRAMYLISASKSQKAKAQLASTRPYFAHVTSTLTEILASSKAGGPGTVDTHFLQYHRAAEDKGNLYIVLGSDKGMAGGYNHNIINLLNEQTDKSTATMYVVGMLGRSQISREGYNVDKEFRYHVMNPSVYRAREIAELVVEEFLAHRYREVHIVYTEMVTPLKQEPVIAQLLPLHPDDFSIVGDKKAVSLESNIVKYEPSAREVFDHLVPHYLKGTIYAAFVEAFTSEQHARMYAMDNATKSADDMISHLSLRYNRARQAQITQEINEIVGGIPND